MVDRSIVRTGIVRVVEDGTAHIDRTVSLPDGTVMRPARPS